MMGYKGMINWKGFGGNFKILFRQSPGGTEENHENSQSG
jgi:hypothetical protein